ncbi:MAG: hypothetical protein H0U74_13330 [Bradymonadaceae bacterium]|nr:hypothetical protein [Lujinxingiaceae bacterium]
MNTKRSALPCPIRLAAVALVLLLGIATQASAHDAAAQRSVVLQVSEDAVSIMLVYVEAPGPRSTLLRARYDLNGDGRIEGEEAELASREMGARMLAGLQFEVANERPGAQPPELRFQVGPKGEVSAAAFIRYTLAQMEPGSTRTVHVRLLAGPDNVATEVASMGSEDVKLHRSEPARKRGPSGTGIILQPGEHWTVVFER